MRIREAQKHMDPTNPDPVASDLDPQHWLTAMPRTRIYWRGKRTRQSLVRIADLNEQLFGLIQVVGNKEKKEVKKGGAPLSFSEMAKRPGNPQPVRRIPFPEKTIAQTNRPRAFFKVSSSVADP
jgi:hypothetical protein